MSEERFGGDLGDLVEELLPIATRLVEAVRDEGPDVVRDVLLSLPTETRARLDAVPGGVMGVFAIVLAGMVSPDATLRQLLGWTETMVEPHRGRGRGRPTLSAAERERQRLVAAAVPEDVAIVLANRAAEQGLTTRQRMLRVIDGERTA